MVSDDKKITITTVTDKKVSDVPLFYNFIRRQSHARYWFRPAKKKYNNPDNREKKLRIWLESSNQYNINLCQVWLLILLTCFIFSLLLSQHNNNLKPPHHIWNCHHNNVKDFRLSRQRFHVTLRWVRDLKGWVFICLLLSFNFEIILAFTTLEKTVRLSSSGTLPSLPICLGHFDTLHYIIPRQHRFGEKRK